ncbi:MAG: short-chain fatty acid transporter [Phycisphaerales bacterium]
MLARLGTLLTRVFRHTAPEPFVLAILLTIVAFVACATLTDTAPGELVGMWSDPSSGVWKFLAFGMQMCLILVTGFAVASSKPVAWALHALASLPRSCAQGALLVALGACTLGVLHWGLGLIGGAILARDVTRTLRTRHIPAHTPLLAGAGYAGMLVWHGGFSGSAPLKMTSQAEVASVFPPGVQADPLSLAETVLSPMNLVGTGGLLVLVPILFMLMAPRHRADTSAEHDAAQTPGTMTEEEFTALSDTRQEDRPGPLVWVLERTPIVNYALAALIGAWALGFYLPGIAHDATGGALGEAGAPSGVLRLDPNTLNLTFLLLALLLHPSPRSLVRAVEDAARGCAGIILQFPLYAGIMGIVASSGLLAQLSAWINDAATPTTLPVMTMGSAALVNLFVPSGGGQWGIQGPLAMQGATDLGVDPGTMVMAVAYGDQLTNMLQPFWALPLLAITGVKAREIVGYTCIAMLGAALWLGLCLLILG